MIVDNLNLEKCLGKGAFGEVYLTTKKGDDKKKYATKKIDREEIEKGEGIKYLKNEIIVLQYLNHPNIVKFEEVKKTKKHYYIVMEFCNGGELSKALENYKKQLKLSLMLMLEDGDHIVEPGEKTEDDIDWESICP